MSTTPLIPVQDIHPASWHADRALGVGGSEAASLFNAGYGCTRRLVFEKRGISPDYHNTESTERLFKRGNMQEAAVVACFVEETGLKVRRVSSRVSKTHPHARVNMDRQIVAVDPQHLHRITADENGFSPLASILLDPGPGYLECKSMNSFDFAKVKKFGLVAHDHYLIQLQHGLGVTGYKWGVFAILDSTSYEMLWFPMLRNEDMIAETLGRTESLWDLVMDTTRDLPAPVPEGDKRCAKCLYRRSCRGDAYLEKHAGADFSTDYITSADPELVELATDYIAAEEAADQAGAIVDTIKARLKERLVADKTPKVKVSDVLRLCLSTSAGRKSWDGKAIEGEINALNKGVVDEEVTAAITFSGWDDATRQAVTAAVAVILPNLAKRIAACQKVGAGSTGLRTFAA